MKSVQTPSLRDHLIRLFACGENPPSPRGEGLVGLCVRCDGTSKPPPPTGSIRGYCESVGNGFPVPLRTVGGLAAARSTRGSDSPPDCHSLPLVSLRYARPYGFYPTSVRDRRGRCLDVPHNKNPPASPGDFHMRAKPYVTGNTQVCVKQLTLAYEQPHKTKAPLPKGSCPSECED